MGRKEIRSELIIFLTLIVIIFSELAHNQEASLNEEPPLRLSEPLDSIIADLEDYIPEYIHEEKIPGVAISLIQDGKLVWTGGYGVANTLTANPVTSGTLFEVASNSKLVTAYIALRLVNKGILSLDAPSNSYLTKPWLPPSEYRDAITLRHILSHSSGLGHLTFSRKSLFAPGEAYCYSNQGFLYLQEAIEQLTNQSLEDIAHELVFKPLSMASSSFINHAEITPRTANGHLHAIIPILLFAVPYSIILVGVGLIDLLILRIWKGHWLATRGMIFGALFIALGLLLLSIFILLGKFGLLELAWLITFCGIMTIIVLTIVFVAVRRLIQWLSTRRTKYQNMLIIILSIFVVACLSQLASEISNLPVPKWPAVSAKAPSSLRATAGDMATFLIELSNPRYLNEEISKQLQSSQVQLGNNLSWGLGPGIQHTTFGDALWQWGQHLDFQSVLIIYPKLGFGVVVLTNNDWQNPDVAIEIAHRVLGGPIKPILRGSHLEFNHSKGG